VRLARAGIGHARLAVSDGRALIVDVLPRPGGAEPVRVAGVLGLALASGAMVPVLRRHRRRHMPTGASARDFLLDYHQIRHETFERERPFARVRLWAQANVAGHPLPADALESACSEFEQIGYGSVMRYAARAAAVGVARARVGSIRQHARTVARGLTEARQLAGDARTARVRETLGAIDALAQDCYEAYWEVVMRAPCRANAVVAQAMLGKTVLLDRGRILSRYEADPGGREPILFDPDELRALMGELIENAARALAGAPDATLEVSVKEHPTDPRRIVIAVRDNGTGIPPGMRETLFEPETSTREGGGFGLFHAREVARRWMAELTLEDPPSGRGSEARLVVRACRVVDRLAHPTPTTGGGR
jgi:signal transduction histidine kinase